MNILKRWIANATPADLRALARAAGTTVGTLRQTAGGYRTRGKLQVTPDLARRLELAAEKLGPLPALDRTKLCPACGRCDLAKRAGR